MSTVGCAYVEGRIGRRWSNLVSVVRSCARPTGPRKLNMARSARARESWCRRRRKESAAVLFFGLMLCDHHVLGASECGAVVVAVGEECLPVGFLAIGAALEVWDHVLGKELQGPHDLRMFGQLPDGHEEGTETP